MSFLSALGSLCGTCVEKVKMSCPCTKTEITINVSGGDHAGDVVRAALEHRNGQVDRDDSSKLAARVKKKTVGDGEEKEDDPDAVDKVSSFGLALINKLGGGDEGWDKLGAAAFRAGADVYEKLRHRQEFTPKEKEELDQHVEYVKDNGGTAASLWELLKKEDIKGEKDLLRLKKIQAITEKQLDIFKTLFTQFQPNVILGTKTFSKANPRIKDVFMQAAEHRKKGEKGTCKSWGEDEACELPDAHELIALPVPKNQEPFFAFRSTLGIQNRRELPDAKNITLGEERLRLLCNVLKVDFEACKAGNFSEKEGEKIAEQIQLLLKCDGIIAYLFECLCKTLDPLTLQNKYGFTEQMIKKIASAFKADKTILFGLKGANEVALVPTITLTLLFEVALLIPEEERIARSHGRTLLDWVKETRNKLSGITPELLPKRVLAGILPLVRINSEDALTPADQAVLAMRDRDNNDRTPTPTAKHIISPKVE